MIDEGRGGLCCSVSSAAPLDSKAATLLYLDFDATFYLLIGEGLPLPIGLNTFAGSCLLNSLIFNSLSLYS
jgi:hypothetical protein